MSGRYASYWNAFLLRMILPPANEVWGKVMFFHPSVSYSVHVGGGVYPSMQWAGGYVTKGYVTGGGVTTGVYGQQAGGMHPTGMLSCLKLELITNDNWSSSFGPP